MQNNIIEIIDNALNTLIKESHKGNYEYLTSDFKTINELKENLEITTFKILNVDKDDCAYISFFGNCPWDIEHGFGFIAHQKRIIEVGGWDTYNGNTLSIGVDKGVYKNMEEAQNFVRKKFSEIRAEANKNKNKVGNTQVGLTWWQRLFGRK